MDAKQILNEYEKVKQVVDIFNLPPLTLHRYSVKPARLITDKSKLYEQLKAFAPVSGWLGYQSGNHHFDHEPFEPKKNYGVLMNAEVWNGSDSLHVRYNGRGGWIVTTFLNDESGDEYLVDDISHIASFNKKQQATLNYRRFWQKEALGINPKFACFVGFGGKS